MQYTSIIFSLPLSLAPALFFSPKQSPFYVAYSLSFKILFSHMRKICDIYFSEYDIFLSMMLFSSMCVFLQMT